jgi:hypothetical protein
MNRPVARKDGALFFYPTHQTIVWKCRQRDIREEDDGPIRCRRYRESLSRVTLSSGERSAAYECSG